MTDPKTEVTVDLALAFTTLLDCTVDRASCEITIQQDYRVAILSGTREQLLDLLKDLVATLHHIDMTENPIDVRFF